MPVSDQVAGRLPFALDPFMLLVVLAVTSLLVFLSSFRSIGIIAGANGAIATGDVYGYFALGAGITSMVLSIIMAILVRFVTSFPKWAILAFAVLMTLFWIGTLIVTTFIAPFTDLGNGYISVWASVILIAVLLFEAGSQFKSAADNLESKFANQSKNIRLLILHIITVSVELASASIVCSGGCVEERIYAVIAGAVGFVLVVLLIVPQIPANAKGYIALVNIVWWMAAVLGLTFFTAGFTIANTNGYLGCWGSFVLSILAGLPYISALNLPFVSKLQSELDTPAAEP